MIHLPIAVLLFGVSAHTACFFSAVPSRTSVLQLNVRLEEGTRTDLQMVIKKSQNGHAARAIALRPGLSRIPIEPGEYLLLIRAAHHQPVAKQIQVQPNDILDVGTLWLQTFARVRGKVVGPELLPIRNASVSIDHVRVTQTAPDGSFAADVPERATTLRVAARSYGTKVVALPALVSDIDLGIVRLVRAAKISIEVEGAHRTLVAQLHREERGRTIAVESQRCARDRIVFGSVDTGVYKVVLSDEKASLTRFGEEIRVRPGERVTRKIAIHPRRVEGVAMIGGTPMRKSVLSFRHVTVGWTADIVTDNTGRFSCDVWQTGVFEVSASGPLVSGRVYTHTIVRAGELHLNFPGTRVEGRVLDRVSGAGISGAKVILRSETAESADTIVRVTDSSGDFRFDGIPSGKQQLTASAVGFLVPPASIFPVSAADAVKEVNLRLDPGQRRHIRVENEEGRPVDAELHAIAGGVLVGTGYTDGEGTAVISVPSDSVVLYVIGHPSGFASIANPKEHDTVILRRPASSLVLRTRTLTGELPPDASFLFALDGQIVPREVLNRLGAAQSKSLRTDQNGQMVLYNLPPGHYEFWPYRTDEEASMIVASVPAAAVAIDLQPGSNFVEVVFQRR